MRNKLIPCYPRRIVNRALFMIGLAGVVLQWIAIVYAYWQGFTISFHWWFHWLAPLLCVLWGTVPALQLQQEAERGSSGDSLF